MSGHEQAPLAGRVAIVTGGATGIGFDICQRLLADGARLALAGLTDADVSAALGRLSDRTGRVSSFAGDLPVPGGADDLLGHALGTFGKMDILVNNAGGGPCCRISSSAGPGGSSASVRNGLTDHAIYNAAKGGVHGLAWEFAGRRHHGQRRRAVLHPHQEARRRAGRRPCPGTLREGAG